MSRTLTSPTRQVSSITWRSSLPRAKQAISRGRRNPRSRNPEVFMATHCNYRSQRSPATDPVLKIPVYLSIIAGFRLRSIRVCMPEEAIQVKGARVNNLKNVSFTVPINQMTVVTGVSGSGKSSLAFDTIYAEGQRRYVESLSAYARQFLERMEKPDVDRIEGICPAIAIRQKNSVRNPRSTVGTMTEIHDYMRLLYARVGRTFCRQCGQEVTRETAEVVARRLGELPEGTRILIGYEIPVVVMPADPAADAADAGEDVPEKDERASDPIVETLNALRRRGFGRLLIDGRAVLIDEIDP